jgi:hypothetical protein
MIRINFETKAFVADVYDEFAGVVVQIACSSYVALILAMRRAQEDRSADPLPSMKDRRDKFVPSVSIPVDRRKA